MDFGTAKARHLHNCRYWPVPYQCLEQFVFAFYFKRPSQLNSQKVPGIISAFFVSEALQDVYD